MAVQSLTQRVLTLETQVSDLRQLPARVEQLGEQIDRLGAELRKEIRAGDEETRRFMRVLYEDLVDRISKIQEGLDHRDH